jgi:hypothetical protein
MRRGGWGARPPLGPERSSRCPLSSPRTRLGPAILLSSSRAAPVSQYRGRRTDPLFLSNVATEEIKANIEHRTLNLQRLRFDAPLWTFNVRCWTLRVRPQRLRKT